MNGTKKNYIITDLIGMLTSFRGFANEKIGLCNEKKNLNVKNVE